jgi:hypothetical protein
MENQMYEVFNKIVSDKELAKRAVNNPAEVFSELGIIVKDPEWVNENIYVIVPDLKKHFLATVAGVGVENPILECKTPACYACLSSMGVVVGALITAAVAAFPEAEALIAEIAELLGIAADFVEELIEEIVKGTLDLSGALTKICQKTMHTC